MTRKYSRKRSRTRRIRPKRSKRTRTTKRPRTKRMRTKRHSKQLGGCDLLGCGTRPPLQLGDPGYWAWVDKQRRKDERAADIVATKAKKAARKDKKTRATAYRKAVIKAERRNPGAASDNSHLDSFRRGRSAALVVNEPPNQATAALVSNQPRGGSRGKVPY